MPAKYPAVLYPQTNEAMDYVKFGKVVGLAWAKSHPDIGFMAQGSKKFDNNKPIITYHLQRRLPISTTPEPRFMQSHVEVETITELDETSTEIEYEIITTRQDFENEIVFTIVVPLDKGGGEVADAICEEFERFMLEHKALFMRLGARNLRYKLRFHDDNLLKEMSQNSVKRFIAYTLYTQTVTQTNVPLLQQLEIEIRAGLDAIDSIHSTEEHTFDQIDELGVLNE